MMYPDNDFFFSDLEQMDDILKNLAKSIYDYCMKNLPIEVHYRPERYNTNGKGQKHTIMRIKSTRNFFLVIDLQQSSRLRLTFPDKKNEFLLWGAEWCNKRQGEQKKEKQIDIFRALKQNEINNLSQDIAIIYDNALKHYNRTHNSTKTLLGMFGKPNSGLAKSIDFPNREERKSIVKDVGTHCKICNNSEDISFFYDKTTKSWQIRCDKHHPDHFKTNSFKGNLIPYIIRKKVWHRDRGKCVICGSDHKLVMGHFLPRNRGKSGFFKGSNGRQNIQLLCQVCNSSESNNL